MIGGERKPFHEPMRLKELTPRRPTLHKTQGAMFQAEERNKAGEHRKKANEAIITEIQSTTKNTNSKKKKK